MKYATFSDISYRNGRMGYACVATAHGELHRKQAGVLAGVTESVEGELLAMAIALTMIPRFGHVLVHTDLGDAESLIYHASRVIYANKYEAAVREVQETLRSRVLRIKVRCVMKGRVRPEHYKRCHREARRQAKQYQAGSWDKFNPCVEELK